MTKFTDLIADPFAQRVYALIVQPYDLINSVIVSEYYGSDNYISTATDTPASTYFAPLMTQALLFSRDLFESGRLGGSSTASTGTIVLDNSTGQLDHWCNYSFAGRQMTLLLGGPGWNLSDFGVVFSGTASGLEFTDVTMTIDISDNTALLEIPMPTALYGGTGAWDSPAGGAVVGKPKPIGFGQVRNAKAAIVDLQNLRYQIHAGAVHAINAVYDEGAALTFYNDYATLVALDGVTIPAGSYATCLAQGCLKTGSRTVGDLTVDFQGDAGYTGYVSSAARILERVLLLAGFTSSFYDTTSIAALDTLNPAVNGYFISDATNISDILDALMNSVGGYYAFNRAGLLEVGRINVPGTTPVLVIDGTMIMEGEFEKDPTDIPTWRITLNYGQNYNVMSGTAIAGSVSAAQVTFLSEQWRSIVAANPTTKVQNLLAQDLTYDSLFDSVTDAQAEATRLLNLYSVQREVYKIGLKTQPFGLDLGQTVQVIYPRYTLSAGKNFTIIGMDENSQTNDVTLELWG